MSSRIIKRQIKQDVSTLDIPPEQWGKFLETFSRHHRDWLIRLETHDRVTGEHVVSQKKPMESIELDLEDEKNPRINVIVQLDNKVIKHILFLPSGWSCRHRMMAKKRSLRIETVNTKSTIYFRAPVPPASA